MNQLDVIKLFFCNSSIKYFGEKLYHCKAEVLDGVITVKSESSTLTMPIKVLKSYSTYVAFMRESTKTLYVLDFYSHTTQQHIYKFARKYGANDVYYLYKRSDNVGYYNFNTHESIKNTQLNGYVKF